MNDYVFILIGIALGVVTVIGTTAIDYTRKRKYFHEVDLEITKSENELLEHVRNIGVSKLQENSTGRELYSLLSQKELIALGKNPVTSTNSEKQLKTFRNTTGTNIATGAVIGAVIGALAGMLRGKGSNDLLDGALTGAATGTVGEAVDKIAVSEVIADTNENEEDTETPRIVTGDSNKTK
jgi:uncharacterized membrane protein